ncbi:MAG: aldehyde dehydrogenase family protein, partial [Deltaproteobacteria bacterium]|nr:aldehyde dehydrogenase family protein [Deltaproteobacteria bacterium]
PIDLFSYWIKNTGRFLEPEKVPINPLKYPAKKGFITYEPKGVIAIITPWNYPVAIPVRNFVPALMAGNVVIFKPASTVPLVSRLLGRIFASELPAGVFNLVQGRGKTGDAILDCGIDHLIFTGSVELGRRLAQKMAARFISFSMELGGKDSAIVLEDCDLERTVEGILWGAFTNCGQNCASIERVYVVEKIYDEFRDRLVKRCGDLRIQGEEFYEAGSLNNEEQLKTVEDHLKDARERGAVVITGGKRFGSGFGFKPTIVEEAPHDSLIIQEESFGPFLPLIKVRDPEEAVRLANQNRYGLTNSVWTRDFRKGAEIAKRLESGVVTINNHSFTAAMPFAPWTGRKETGGGTTNSHIALMEMVHPKFILTDRNKAREIWWYPYNQAAVEMAKSLAVLITGGAKGKFRAFVNLIRNFARRFTSQSR